MKSLALSKRVGLTSRVTGFTMLTRISSIALAALFTACTASYYLDSAEDFYRRGDYESAIKGYLRAIGEDDKEAEAYHGLAMSYYQIGDTEGAMFAFEKALEMDSLYTSAYECLASIYLDMGRPDAAITLCRKAIQIDSEYVGAYITLANALFERGPVVTAINTLWGAIKLTKRLQADPVKRSYYGSLRNEQGSIQRSRTGVPVTGAAQLRTGGSRKRHRSLSLLGATMVQQGESI